MTSSRLWLYPRPVALVLLAIAGGCSGGRDTAGPTVPLPDLTDMEPQVAARLEELGATIEADPASAQAWGHFGMVLHAHELLDEAAVAYAEARRLDPDDERWAYYHGEVLSVIGSDLEAAESALREFVEARPDYAAGRMRLGKVLVALNRPREAAVELDRALELDPELQPARLTLAQIRLAADELDAAQRLLEQVLSAAPRHEQALTTLGQVYMRQGRRDEARQIAEQAGEAAAYNLYSDPLMSEVVAEELSSVQLWERAKAFLDNGNYEQATIGLARVVDLTPDNADAHLQLAVAYAHLGQAVSALRHLERSAQLQPDVADTQTRLGGLYLDLDRPGDAIEPLRAAVALEPGKAEAQWLLGRALLRGGRTHEAVEVFESVSPEAPVPASAHNDWGNALAQGGRLDAALEHFEAAIEQSPENPQSLYFAGLAQEGLSAVEEAVSLYCRSLAVDSRSPAAERVAALGRRCP